MGALIDMQGKMKRYYKFSPSELRGFIISILVLGFIIGFDDGRVTRSIDIYWIWNLLNSILIVTLVFIIYNVAQRIAGWSVGYNTEYKMWTIGLLIGLIFAFVSRGRIWVLLPGGIMIHHLAGHRLGHFRYELNYFQHGMVAVAGTIALISLAALFKILNTVFYSSLLDKLILFCIVFAIYDIMPIPPLSGSRLFFGSRMTYVFMLFTIVIAGILLLIDINVMMAIFGSIVIGVICWLLYYIFFERKAWSGPWPKK